jgi:PAS domain S-box-containing protein
MSQPTQKKKDLKPAEIIAIDDDEWFLRLLIKKFEDVDPALKITPASTVEEALKLLEEKTFDTILCDHKLPGTIEIHGKRFPCDGIHLMRKFKDEMRIDTPFIFVTGQGSEEIASQALQLGSAGYFIKRVQPGYYSLMATSIRQIIDRHWLQRELKESELRYRELFENSTGLIFIFDTEGNLQESNQNFYRVFGYDENEILTVSQLAHAQDLNKWHDMINSVTKGNNEVTLLRSVTKDGEVLHLDINAGPIWGFKKKSIVGIQAIARNISDQVKTQQALIDSEEKYRKIIEGSIEGIIYLDSEGTIIDWNPAATMITGVKTEDAVGKKFSEIVIYLKPSMMNKPEVLMDLKDGILPDFVSKMITESTHTSKMTVYSLENIVTGRRHTLEAVGFIIEHSKGNRYALVIRDVTERRIAEAESRSFAKRFQMLIEQTAIGVWISDAHTEVTTYVNESIAQLLGYSPREIIGVPVLDFATPESAQIIKEKTRSRILNEGKNETYELDFYHRDGRIIQTLVTAAAIQDEDGIIQETYGLIRDITEEREREKELKRTKTFLESIINAMSSGVYSYNLNKRITMANPRLATILGYTSETELIGKLVYDLFPEREHTRVSKYIEERLNGRPSEEFIPITYITRQGEEINTLVSSVPLIIENEVEGSVVSVSDITEQKRIREYLHQLSQEHGTLLEKIPIGIAKVDKLGKIITFNQKVVEILQMLDSEDLKNLDILEYHPFKEAGVTKHFRDLLYKKTEEETIDTSLIDMEGKKYNVRFSFFPVTDQDKEIISWFLFINPLG